MSVHLFQFEDFTSFKNACKLPNSCPSTCKQNSQGVNANYGTRDYDEAEQLAISGMPEIENLVSQMSLEINSDLRPVSSLMTFEYAEVGSYPDISMFLAGENECMINYQYEERKTTKKVVTIAVQGGALSDVTVEEFKIRGAAICALVDALERADYRVEVIYYASSRCVKSNDEYIAVSFTLKKASEQIDFSRLCYCLCSASMFRRHVWKFRETLDASLRKQLGLSKNVAETITDDLPIKQVQADVKILSDDWYKFYSVTSAKKYVNNVLSTLI